MDDLKSTLSRWFEEYHMDLFKFIYKLTGDYHLSEDIVQETYVRAYLKFHLFDPGRGNLKNWLYRMAINLYHDHERFQNKEIQVLEKISKESPNIWENQRDDESQLDKVFLEEAISKLSSDKRTILLLSLRNKFEEISEILGIPEGTVKSRLFYIRKELLQTIEKLRKEE